jgi:putative flavoprotein involved in K+ transport
MAMRVDREATGGWRVVGSDGDLAARHVVVATGWDAEPKLPAWTDGSRFSGRLLHACELVRPSDFRASRVLVVGAGNSGIDIAGLLVRSGATGAPGSTSPGSRSR